MKQQAFLLWIFISNDSPEKKKKLLAVIVQRDKKETTKDGCSSCGNCWSVVSNPEPPHSRLLRVTVATV